MAVKDILSTHPKLDTFDLDELARCIEALGACVAACNICADACLYEDADLRDCIQMNLDCADICTATMKVLSRPGPTGDTWHHLLEVCARACAKCAQRCGSHDHDHCKACSTACKAAEQACQQLLAAAARS